MNPADLTAAQCEALVEAHRLATARAEEAAAAAAAFTAACQSGTVEEQGETATGVTSTFMALCRALLHLGQFGGAIGFGLTQADIVRWMRALQDAARADAPIALETAVRIAVRQEPLSAGDTGERPWARDLLAGLGLLTEYELETFPEASLKAIVVQRFHEQQD